MSTDLKKTFWSRISDVQAGMLDTGNGRYVPMSPNIDDEQNAIWFITAEGTDAEREADSGATARFIVADPKSDLYANIEGQLTEVNDEAKLDELWNAVAAAWFKDGREDKDIRLIKFTPHQAEIWATGSSIGFLYEIAKANLTEDTADAGEHGKVTF